MILECSIGPRHSAECEYFADSNLYSKGILSFTFLFYK